MMKTALTNLCYTCNKKEEKEFFKVFINTPVSKKECASCHKPHSSSYKSLLIDSSQQLCVKCHGDMFLEVKEEVIHPPFKDKSCETCHDPHSSDYPDNTVLPM